MQRPLLPLLWLTRHLSSSAAPVAGTAAASKQQSGITYGGMSSGTFKMLVEDMSPFVKTIMPLQVVHLSKGKLSVKLPFKPDYIGNAVVPALHGGVVASIIDHVGGFTAWSCLEGTRSDGTRSDGARSMIATVDLRIDYLRPAPLEDLEAIGTVLHSGPHKSLIRVDINLYSTKDRVIIATGRGTFKSFVAKQTFSDDTETVSGFIEGGFMQKSIDKLLKNLEQTETK